MNPDPEITLFWRYIVSSLDRLVACLENQTVEQLNWRPYPNANSLFVLATHTLANAKENLLGVLCGLPLERHRESEFTAQASTVEAFQNDWQALRTQIAQQLAALPMGTLDSPRNHPRRGQVTGRDLLIIVARHAAEHLGQAEMTRDLLEAAVAVRQNHGET